MFTAFASEPPTPSGGSARKRGLGAALAVILAPALALSALVAVAPLPSDSGAPLGPSSAHAAPERQVIAPAQMTMLGQRLVGEPLSINLGQWTPAAGLLEKQYSWYRNGQLIPGADQPTYTPTADDYKQAIRAQVFGWYTDELNGASSQTNQVVIGGTISEPASMVIGGEPRVGKTVSVIANGQFEPQPVNVNYRWFYGAREVENGGSSSHVIQWDGVGQQIRVEVTGSKPYYEPKTLSLTGGWITQGEFRIVKGTKILGTPKVGEELTAQVPEFDPMPTGVDYVWKYYADSSGKILSTSRSYTPSVADRDKRLEVRATAIRPGFLPLPAVSDAVIIQPADVRGTQPSITGPVRVGSALVAEPGAWGPTGTALSYQWQLDGQRIDGATSKTYTPSASDHRKILSVAVTGTLNGYNPKTLLSVGQTVQDGVFSNLARPQLAGPARVGQVLNVTPGGWSPAPERTVYEWYRYGSSEIIATGSSYVVQPADAGKRLYVLEKVTRDTYALKGEISNVIDVREQSFTEAPRPTILGTVVVGSKVTAEIGTWRPVPGKVTVQWLRNGAAIPNATGTEYTPVADDADTALSVRVFATKDGYEPTERTSDPRAVPELLEFTRTPTPAVSGIAKVGSRLTAVTGAWRPTPTEYRYQWLRDGDPIADATAPDYTPVGADLGRQLAVRVTAIRPGYRTGGELSPGVEIGAVDPAPSNFTDAPNPTLSVTGGGPVKVGAKVTAVPGNWTPTPDDYAYQWLRDGSDIAGATQSSYTPVAADQGSHLLVRVTARKTDYRATSRTSAGSLVAAGDPAPLEFVKAPLPSIAGTAKVGVQLMAFPGAWEPTPDFAYQWLRDGKAIPSLSALTPNYTPVLADVGHALSVKVTATLSGYRTTERESPAQSVAAADPVLLDFVKSPAPALPQEVKVGVKVTPALGTWEPQPDFAYQWMRGNEVIPGATGREYTPGNADAGRQLALRVTATKTGYTPTTRLSPAREVADTAPGGADFTKSPTPTLPLGIRVGVPVEPVIGTWEPAPDALAYQWLRNGSAIQGATGASYTPSVFDEGKALSLLVTASKGGYRTTPSVSVAQDVGPATGTALKDFTKTPRPSISVPGGSAVKVGAQLTAVSGAWEPTPDILAYQWLRGGAEIEGATSMNYTPVVADQGKQLSVRVAVGKTGYRTASMTSPAQSVEPAEPGLQEFGDAPKPSIDGSMRVGEPVTAIAGAWSPTPSALEYQWFRGDAPIPGATSASYTLIAADQDRAITVRVTASRAGYTTTPRTSDARTGLPADLTLQRFIAAPTPSISVSGGGGPAKVGIELEVEHGQWEPTPGAFSYVWERDGLPIGGAITPSYIPVADDAGHAITVRLTAKRAGYVDTVRASIPLAILPAGPELLDFADAPEPAISGTVRVGATVTAAPGAWAPEPAAFTYQWLRNGDPILGATASAYTPVAGDQGALLSVRVTASRPGYATTTKASTQQQVLAIDTGLTDFITAPNPLVSVADGGQAEVGSLLTAAAGTWAPAPDALVYQWERDGKAIPGATSSAYTATSADANAQLVVWVTASKTGHRTAMRPSVALRVKPAAADLKDFTATPVPTVAGTLRVNGTVTAAPGAWEPEPDAFSYQWLRGGDPIPGARSSAYSPVVADEGQLLSVRVTAVKDGYRSPTVVSAARPVASDDPALSGFGTAPSPSFAVEPGEGDGKLRVGAKATATPGAWDPMPASFEYQWERNGYRIPGATSASYTPVAADEGKMLAVWVTAMKAGYRTTTRVSAVEQVLPALVGLEAFDAAPKPSISGAVRVDSVVSAAPGEWLPDPDAFAFQWLRDGSPIVGATSAAYLPNDADEGAKLSVRVTASKVGYRSDSRTSDEYEVREADPAVLSFVKAPKPEYTSAGDGPVKVGSELTVEVGEWEPEPDVTAYQWLRNGGIIPGANEQTYTPVADDEGARLSVRVTMMKADYRTTLRVSDEREVGPADPLPLEFAKAPIPTVSVATGGSAPGGAVKVGAKLTAVPGTWEPTPGAPLAYQWLRNGTEIKGAVAATYTPLVTDLGAQLSVRVTATKTGYRTTAKASAALKIVAATPVLKKLTATPKPKISGTARVGKKLAVKVGTWKPAKVTLKYQWLRNGKAIKGATKSKYRIAKKDRGKRISVRVTGKKTGYTTVSRVSSAKRVR